MRWAWGLAAIAVCGATSAWAALAPEYYQRAREQAADVVVIDVAHVDPPARPAGDCQVLGAVRSVERGTTYRVGQEIEITVPCMRPSAEIPSGPVIWQDLTTLSRAPAGRAFLNNGALVLYQYEVLR